MGMLRFLLMMGFIIGALPVTTAQAQETATAVIQVDGLSCPFCTYGLEKQLKKVDGVKSVSINMKAGKTTVFLKPDANVDDKALRNAVKKAGFTARDISRQ